MTKRYLNIFIGLFAAIFLLLPVISMVTGQREFSDLENRVLQRWPNFSVSALFKGEWIPDLEAMMNDQFVGRDLWVQLKASCDALLGKKDIGGAYIGEDGWLFEQREAAEEGRLERNAQLVAEFAQWAKSENISTRFLPAYSAPVIYPEKMPQNATVADERAMLNRLSGINVIDPYDRMQAAKDKHIYFKTDHHWTQLGAYQAYLALAEAEGFTPVSWENVQSSDAPFYGTLYSRAPLPWIQGDPLEYLPIANVTEVYYDGQPSGDTSPYKAENLAKKDQYTFFLDGNHATQDIRTSNNTGRTLAIFKDSYAHALAPLLTAHYDRIILIDLRYFTQPVHAYLQDEGVTDVLISYNLSWFADDVNIARLRKVS